MLSLRIALRYLLAKKTHTAVNIISWISVTVVAVAAAAIIVVLSVFNGFTDLALGHLSVLDPPLKVTPVSGKSIAGADSLGRRLEELESVSAALPVVEERGLLVSGPHQQPVVFMGVPDAFVRESDIDSAIVDGSASMAFAGRPGVILSAGVAVGTGLRPSAESQASLYVPRRLGRIQAANPTAAFRGDSFCVTGVFQVNQPEYDTEHVIVPLSVARDLLSYDDAEASALSVWLADGVSAESAAGELRGILGSDFEVRDRMHQQEKSFRMIAIEKWITFLMLAFILIVASFNVISTLSMLVLEKRDDLYTLRALGAPSRMIGSIFVWQGWLISFVGGLIGVVLGAALTLAQQFGGFIRLNADPSTLTVTVYPVRLSLPDLLVVAAVCAAVGLLTSRVTAYFIHNQLRE